MLSKPRLLFPGSEACQQVPADPSAAGGKGRVDTQALPRQGATHPPVTSHFPPIAYSNSKEADVHSSVNHMRALKGCAPSITHTGVRTDTASPHVFPHTLTLGPPTHNMATCQSTAGPWGDVRGVLLWGFLLSKGAIMGADRGGLRYTQVGEGLAPQCPRGVTGLLDQPDTMKC